MQQPVEVKPKRYPTNLLNKDWSKRHCYYRDNHEKFLSKVHDVQVFEDDVWLVTMPKCGTTWMQELLWLVMNDFDFETAKIEHLEIRSPYMEFDYSIYRDFERAFKPIENLKRPRLIKSHLSLPLLPAQIWDKKPKVVYVARNIKDAMVSEYHQRLNLGHLPLHCTIDQYINDQLQVQRGNETFENLTEFYALRSEPWLFYISFERMKLNLPEVITEVCQFLNKTIDDATMQQMWQHLSFDAMKKNPMTNHQWEFEQVRKVRGLPQEDGFNFCRKGKMNVYKEELSPETIAQLDKWVNENMSRYNLTMDDLLLVKDSDNVNVNKKQ